MTFRGQAGEQFIGGVAFEIEEDEALAGLGLLQCQASDERRLANTGGTENQGMGGRARSGLHEAASAHAWPVAQPEDPAAAAGRNPHGRQQTRCCAVPDARNSRRVHRPPDESD